MSQKKKEQRRRSRGCKEKGLAYSTIGQGVGSAKSGDWTDSDPNSGIRNLAAKHGGPGTNLAPEPHYMDPTNLLLGQYTP